MSQKNNPESPKESHLQYDKLGKKFSDLGSQLDDNLKVQEITTEETNSRAFFLFSFILSLSFFLSLGGRERERVSVCASMGGGNLSKLHTPCGDQHTAQFHNPEMMT